VSRKKFIVLIAKDKDPNVFVESFRKNNSELIYFIPRSERFSKKAYDRILKSVRDIVDHNESVVVINDLFPYFGVHGEKIVTQEFEFLIKLTNFLTRHNLPIIHLSNQNFDTLDMNDYFEFPEYIRLALSMEVFASHYGRSITFRNPQFFETTEGDLFYIDVEKLSQIIYFTALFLNHENNSKIPDKYTSFFKDDFFHNFITKYKLVSTGMPKDGAFDSNITKLGFAHRWVFVENATVILHMLEDLNFFINKNQNYLQDYLLLS
jgi:hypothetical protein